MWLELDYILESFKGKRQLLIRSNFKQDENGEAYIEDGVYKILEYAYCHYHFTAGPDGAPQDQIQSYWEFNELGTIVYRWRHSNQIVWSGQLDEFTRDELAKIAHFASTWHEPAAIDPTDLNVDGVYIDDGGIIEIKTVSFPEKSLIVGSLKDDWLTDLWDSAGDDQRNIDQ